MADDFHLDPEAVHGTSGSIRVAQDALNAAFNTLQAKLDDMGACWGDDDIGKNFGKNYAPNSKKVRDAIGGVVTGLGDFADGLDSASTGFQALDGENADQLRQADSDFREQLDAPPPS